MDSEESARIGEVEAVQAKMESLLESLTFEDEMEPQVRMDKLRDAEPQVWEGVTLDEFNNLLQEIHDDPDLSQMILLGRREVEGITCVCGETIMEDAEYDEQVVDDEEEEGEPSHFEKHFLDMIKAAGAEDVHMRVFKDKELFPGSTKCPAEDCEDRNPEFESVHDLLRHFQTSNEEAHAGFMDDIAYSLMGIEGGNALLPAGIQDMLRNEDIAKLQILTGFSHMVDEEMFGELDGEGGMGPEISMEDLAQLIQNGMVDLGNPELMEALKGMGVEAGDMGTIEEEQ